MGSIFDVWCLHVMTGVVLCLLFDISIRQNGVELVPKLPPLRLPNGTASTLVIPSEAVRACLCATSKYLAEYDPIPLFEPQQLPSPLSQLSAPCTHLAAHLSRVFHSRASRLFHFHRHSLGLGHDFIGGNESPGLARKASPSRPHLAPPHGQGNVNSPSTAAHASRSVFCRRTLSCTPGLSLPHARFSLSTFRSRIAITACIFYLSGGGRDSAGAGVVRARALRRIWPQRVLPRQSFRCGLWLAYACIWP